MSLCDDFFGKHVATPSEMEVVTIRVDSLRSLLRSLTARVKSTEPAHAEFVERVGRPERERAAGKR